MKIEGEIKERYVIELKRLCDGLALPCPLSLIKRILDKRLHEGHRPKTVACAVIHVAFGVSKLSLQRHTGISPRAISRFVKKMRREGIA